MLGRRHECRLSEEGFERLLGGCNVGISWAWKDRTNNSPVWMVKRRADSEGCV